MRVRKVLLRLEEAHGEYEVMVNISILKLYMPVSMAEGSKASTVFSRSNIGITGLNPARGIDVCLRLSVLCCHV
jgi:hypothetical protein